MMKQGGHVARRRMSVLWETEHAEPAPFVEGSITTNILPIELRQYFKIGKNVEISDGTPFHVKQVHVKDVKLVTMLGEGELSMDGFERVWRLQNYPVLPLGLSEIYCFLVNPELVPLSWREPFPGGYIRRIFFDNTVLEISGCRHTYYFFWKDGAPNWGSYLLGLARYPQDLSAVL